MSRINGAQDPLGQMREQFTLREKENEERHREEIHELKDTHQAELEKVRGENQKQVKELQNENNSKLNSRDLQYQKEIEAIKALYAKRAVEGKKPE